MTPAPACNCLTVVSGEGLLPATERNEPSFRREACYSGIALGNPANDAHGLDRSADAWQIGGTIAGSCSNGETLLGDPVLPRVVWPDRDPPSGDRCGNRLVECVRQRVEFGFDLDSDRLERRLCRMAARAAGRDGDRCSDDLGELRRALHRPGGDDCVGDTVGEAFVAASPNDPCKLVALVAIHDIVRRPLLFVVHSHIDGAVVTVCTAAFEPVELRGRDTEIEPRTADLADPVLGERLVQVLGTLTTRADPVSEL